MKRSSFYARIIVTFSLFLVAGVAFAATPYPTSNLGRGSTNTAQVQQLQDYLISVGLLKQDDIANGGYGVYGPRTEAAVGNLQAWLNVDVGSNWGYYGPKTIAALNETTNNGQLDLNELPSLKAPPVSPEPDTPVLQFPASLPPPVSLNDLTNTNNPTVNPSPVVPPSSTSGLNPDISSVGPNPPPSNSSQNSCKLFALGDSIARLYYSIRDPNGGTGALAETLNKTDGFNQVGAIPDAGVDYKGHHYYGIYQDFEQKLSDNQLKNIRDNGIAIFSGTNNRKQIEAVKLTVADLVNNKKISPNQIYLGNILNSVPDSGAFNKAIRSFVENPTDPRLKGIHLVDISRARSTDGTHPYRSDLKAAIGCNSSSTTNPTPNISSLPNSTPLPSSLPLPAPLQPIPTFSYSGGSPQVSVPPSSTSDVPGTAPPGTGPGAAPGVAINGTLSGIPLKNIATALCNPTALQVERSRGKTSSPDCFDPTNGKGGLAEKITYSCPPLSNNRYSWACGTVSVISPQAHYSIAPPTSPYFSSMRWDYTKINPTNPDNAPAVLSNYYLQLYFPKVTGGTGACVNTEIADWGPTAILSSSAGARSYDLSPKTYTALGGDSNETYVQLGRLSGGSVTGTIIYSRLVPKAGARTGLFAPDVCGG